MSLNQIKHNPFSFGSIVGGYFFIDRSSERRELAQDIYNHANVILYSPRRYGKSSLILKVFDTLKNDNPDFVGLYIDFYRVHSKEKFLQILAKEYNKNVGWGIETAIQFFKQIIHSVQPIISVDEQGSPQLELSFAQQTETSAFDEIVALPKRLAEEGKLVCVVMDEFQEINKLNGAVFQKELRAVIQQHANVSYIFCGSKQHLINQIFSHQGSPLYNIGKMKYIAKIPADDFIPFIANNIQSVQPTFNTTQARAIYTVANGIPYYVQMLAYEYYNLALLNRDLTSEDLLEAAIAKLITEKSEEYTTVYSYLSPSQKRALDIVIVEKGINLFRQAILAKYRIAGSTLKKAINALIETGFLGHEKSQYHFEDPFFRRWLKLTA